MVTKKVPEICNPFVRAVQKKSQNTTRTIAIAGVSLVALILIAGGVWIVNLNTQIAALQSDIQDLQTENEDLQDENAGLEDDLTEAIEDQCVAEFFIEINESVSFDYNTLSDYDIVMISVLFVGLSRDAYDQIVEDYDDGLWTDDDGFDDYYSENAEIGLFAMENVAWGNATGCMIDDNPYLDGETLPLADPQQFISYNPSAWVFIPVVLSVGFVNATDELEEEYLLIDITSGLNAGFVNSEYVMEECGDEFMFSIYEIAAPVSGDSEITFIINGETTIVEETIT